MELSVMTVVLAAALCIAATAVIAFLPAILIKRWHQEQLKALVRGKLALTYDDGPGRQLTPALVDLLERHDARATFFLVGFRAVAAPQVCDRLKMAGHELGCHTHMHMKPWKIMPWTTARDMRDGYASMAPWLVPEAPFRPPFGKLTTWTWLEAKRRGAPLCFWTVDGCDTHPRLPDPEQVARAIVNQDGAIVLLHSHDRGDDRAAYVLAVTEHLLRLARQRGLQICTMSEILGAAARGAEVPA